MVIRNVKTDVDVWGFTSIFGTMVLKFIVYFSGNGIEIASLWRIIDWFSAGYAKLFKQ